MIEVRVRAAFYERESVVRCASFAPVLLPILLHAIDGY